MTQSLQLGPMTLPVSLVLLIVAILLALFVGKRIGRASGIDAEHTILWGVLVSLFAARSAFVWQFRDAYFSVPASMLDIRDGGWTPLAGFITAWAYLLYLGLRRAPVFKASLVALVTASVVYAGGVLLVTIKQQPEQPLPHITMPAVTGDVVALDAFKGKPTVVNLWATWCPPCHREMPVLERAQQDHPDMHFVFVNQGESAEHVMQYLAKNKLALDNLLLDAQGDTAKHFGQRGLPATLFFNAQGILVSARLGELSHATLAKRLESITSTSP